MIPSEQPAREDYWANSTKLCRRFLGEIPIFGTCVRLSLEPQGHSCSQGEIGMAIKLSMGDGAAREAEREREREMAFCMASRGHYEGNEWKHAHIGGRRKLRLLVIVATVDGLQLALRWERGNINGLLHEALQQRLAQMLVQHKKGMAQPGAVMRKSPPHLPSLFKT